MLRAMEALAFNLKRLRKTHNLTQSQLATQAGIPRASLASMEKVGSNPGVESVVAVAKALGVPLDELLTPSPEMRYYKVSAKDAQEYRSKDGFFLSRLISPIASKGVQIQEITMRPSCYSIGRPHPMGSSEYFYAYRGNAQINLEGDVVDIEAGALLQFPGHFKHIYINPSKEESIFAVSVVVFDPG